MYEIVGKYLYIVFFIILSWAFFILWKEILPYRNFPSVLFDWKLIIACIRGKYPVIKYLKNYSLNFFMTMSMIFEKDGLSFAWFVNPIIFVTNEQYAKILLNDDSAVGKSLFIYDILSELTGKGILTHDGPQWRKRKKLINPAFKFEMLREYVTTFNRCAKLAVKRLSALGDKPTSQVLHIIKATSLKAVCETTFGFHMDSEEEEEKFSAMDETVSRLGFYTSHRLLRPWLYFEKLQLLFKVGRTYQKDYQDARNFTKYLIKRAMKRYDTNNSNTEDRSDGDWNRKALFNMLLDHHASDPTFTMADLQSETQTILFAGYDTLTHTMHWCLLLLALHPEIQEKALEEIDSVVGRDDCDISYEDLNNLKYLESIVKETLRIYPAVPGFIRRLSKDIECGKYTIPRNTVIVFITYLLHRNPIIYPDPEKFDPNRFYDKPMKHPWAFIPFAEGIRTCIGKNFAMVEIKIFLARILRNFRLSLLDKDIPIEAECRVVLELSSPVLFILTKR